MQTEKRISSEVNNNKTMHNILLVDISTDMTWLGWDAFVFAVVATDGAVTETAAAAGV